MEVHSGYQPPENNYQDELAAQLRTREISRTASERQEIIEYDTGQRITRRAKLEVTPTDMQRFGCPEHARLVETHTEDSRTGGGVITNPLRSNSQSLMARGYPELQPFIQTLKGFHGSTLTFSTPEILSLPLMLFSKEPESQELARALLLNPVVMAVMMGKLFFPFNRSYGISVPKAKAYFTERDEVVPADKITPEYDGFVACLRGARPELPELPFALDLLIFNPRELSQTAKEDPASPVVPTPDNALFLLRYQRDFHGRDVPPQVSLSSYPYHTQKFNAVDTIDLEGIEAERGSGFYVKLDRAWVEQVARLAPLPVEESDCGATFGHPVINRDFQNLRMELHQRACIIQAVAKEAGPIIERLNDDSAWRPVKSQSELAHFDDAPQGKLALFRAQIEKPKSGYSNEDLRISRSIMELAPEQAEILRRVLELSDEDKRAVGILNSERSVYELKMF